MERSINPFPFNGQFIRSRENTGVKMLETCLSMRGVGVVWTVFKSPAGVSTEQ